MSEASEMTNVQIADAIESAFCASSSEFGSTMREAAARLRNVTVRSDNSKVIAELQRRLKVAEGAIKWCLEQANEIGAASLGKIEQAALSMSMAGCVRRCERALAAIRDEGGAK